MSKNPNTISFTVSVNRKDLENFDLVYPRCRQRLIANLLHLVVNDRKLFDSIFFYDILSSNDSSNFCI